MTPDQIEKVRAAMALPGWRWMAGMRQCYGPARMRIKSDDELTDEERHAEPIALAAMYPFLPDPSGPATAGCLLALCQPCLAAVFGEGALVQRDMGEPHYMATSLGWACVEYALALGRWPGGLEE